MKRSPLVDHLPEILNDRDEYIGELEAELKRLNRLPNKPTFNKNKKDSQKKPLLPGTKRPGSVKEHKTQTLQIHYQHYHQGVTQGLLWQQLKEWSIKISRGRLNRLLIEIKFPFMKTKKNLYCWYVYFILHPS